MTLLEQKFAVFDGENPHIYKLFCKYANEAIEAGKTKISHWLIVNRIRWDSEVLTQTDDKFKISNDYIALYARKYMSEHPNNQIFNIKEMKR